MWGQADQTENPMLRLKQELDGLSRYITRVRQEVAAIDRPADQTDDFESMVDQMHAVVKATEAATETIMEAMESNGAVVAQLREKIEDPEQLALLDKITNNASDVFEACSFQDITGQRVGRVAKSITFVEERVEMLKQLLGEQETAEVEVNGEEISEEDALLNGPQLDGEGLSQDDIDGLFD
jgi:chemotaxis protein CheZ